MNVVRIWVVLAVFMAAIVPFCLAAAAEEGAVAPPSGFRSLLSGKDLAGWQEKGKAPEHWSMQDGTLVYDGKGADLRTVEKFENFIILVDWKVPPNGNSGVFLRDSTQVEINDADKPPRKIWGGTTGGLYPEKPPVKRAAKPAGEWNHYEISVEKGVITVKLNGETTVDHYEKNWGKTKSGPIGLQNHGSPLWFRNIFVKPLPNGEQK
ncbi:MAG: DUF1080 domain-containing protein [Thermoguttaceae bacterium]